MSHIFDKQQNIDRVVYALYAACAGSVIAELFIHKHGHFWFENVFVFHAVFGFCAYVSLIFAAKALRRIVKRKETYYGE